MLVYQRVKCQKTMSEYMPDKMSECHIECQIDCQIMRQKCPNIWQIEFRIYVRQNVRGMSPSASGAFIIQKQEL